MFIVTFVVRLEGASSIWGKSNQLLSLISNARLSRQHTKLALNFVDAYPLGEPHVGSIYGFFRINY